MVSEVTLGITMDFRVTRVVHFLLGYITMLSYAAHLTCSEAGYDGDKNVCNSSAF